MPQSTRFALPLLQAGQSQKETTHNEALARVDVLLHLAVESRQLASPPSSAARGCWIVAADATAAWAGHENEVAVIDDAGLSFITPRSGCIAYIRDEAVFAYFNDGRWVADAWPVNGLAVAGRNVLSAPPPHLTAPTGGSVVDIEARSAIARLGAALATLGLVTGV